VSEAAPITASEERLDHPAVQAWHRVRPREAAPRALELVKRKRKSEVWRLVGAAGGAPLIAKRCLGETAELERTIYGEILPRLPVSSIHYHGWTAEPGSERCWIFLDDAGDVALSKTDRSHRVLAARWLAALHASARGVDAVERLPERGPEHYRKHLRSGRERILRHLSNPTLTAQDRGSLGGILERLQRVESHWAEVEERCAPLPRTLVHGDFIRKNVRIRAGRDRREVLAMDWEVAGVGMPGPDLLYVDTAAYGEAIETAWPDLGPQSLATLLQLGQLFRGALAPIDWSSTSLAYPSVERAMAMLRLYHERLATFMQELGWRD
jgi:hypothetical protein